MDSEAEVDASIEEDEAGAEDDEDGAAGIDDGYDGGAEDNAGDDERRLEEGSEGAITDGPDCTAAVDEGAVPDVDAAAEDDADEDAVAMAMDVSCISSSNSVPSTEVN